MKTKPLTIFFSVGEPSGDLHGANLIRALRQMNPTVQAVGFGGPRMQDAGMAVLSDLTQLAVMWIVQAVLNVHKFWQLLRMADRYFASERPDAVVLIDFPGFNWWIARKARKHGIPVFYYGAPQMWAWASWRIRKMRRLVDHVLCKLPFEADWYQQRGCEAHYVGHPYFDELAAKKLDPEFLQRIGARRTGPLVTILPGSRTQEVKNNLPWFLKAAELILRDVPAARFAIASFNERQADMARAAIAGTRLPVEVFVQRTSELIQLSRCCMACSGSVSLELMYYSKPAVILYWLNRRMYLFAKYLMLRVKYMTLVNLLACEDRFDRASAPYDPLQPGAENVPYPEYPTCGDKSSQLANHVISWLQNPGERQRRVDQLTRLRARFGSTGATQSAARFLLEKLGHTPLPNATVPSRAA